DPFFRHRRIELKREPAHLHRPIKSSNGFFQPPLADVAPGADHVGNYVNGNCHWRFLVELRWSNIERCRAELETSCSCNRPTTVRKELGPAPSSQAGSGFEGCG